MVVVEDGFVGSGISVGAIGGAVGFSSSFSALTSGSRRCSGNFSAAASSGAETVVFVASVFSSIVCSLLYYTCVPRSEFCV